MRSVGAYLKSARKTKRLDLSDLSDKTKIKASYISAIERQDWDKLPEFAVVSGFVKNISEALGLDKKTAIALLRRDYPPSKQEINPKPDVKIVGFRWSPRLTFALGVGAILLMVLAYLGYSYWRFLQPPSLVVNTPLSDQVINEPSVVVSGRTDSDATVRVGDQPVIVNDEGEFNVTIEVSEEINEIVVRAVSRSERETVVAREVDVRL